MTNLQAIDLLKGLEQSLDDYCELNDEGKTAFGMAITALEQFGNSEPLPSAQPERLTDDDFETIRIHLNAYKEKLCNQKRWKEAEEYQRIIDRFMAFASAQPEVIHCRECRHHHYESKDIPYCDRIDYGYGWKDNDFCSRAKRRTDE